MTPAMPQDVSAVFAGYPGQARAVLEDARELVFRVAADCDVGPLTEALKWGEPAYLTEATGAGSTVRLGVNKGRPAAFFICHTGLVDGFEADFPEAFEYVGNRGLILGPDFDRNALALCLTRALTYHRQKRRRA